MSHQLGIRVFLANYKNCVAVFAPGLAFEKNSVLCLFTIKTLTKICVYRYTELKHYPSFAFIII